MSFTTSNTPTLADLAKTWGPDSKPARIVEMLSQTNEILTDMGWQESNQPLSHLTTVRTALPQAQWREFNKGVGKSKSQTRQITEPTAMLEAYSEVDKELADLNGNTAAFRLSEAAAFLEGMNQQMAQTLFYGNLATNSKSFNGLATRYNTLGGEIGQNVIDAGGTGTDNTSIWLVGWGEQSIYGLYPKGKQGGLQHEDLGQHTLLDADGNQFQGYRDHFIWRNGIAVKDWRYGVRIANVSLAQLKDPNAAPDLVNLIIAALHRLPNRSSVRPALYMNRTAAQYFDIQAVNKPSLGLTTVKGTEGQFWTDFRGLPFRTVDALIQGEARVV